MKILIVEDDPVARKLLEKQAAAFGETVLASNGAEAREFFEAAFHSADPFSLALVDIGLPVEDGLDFIASIRLMENEKGDVKPLPIIIVTGSTEKADVAQAETFDIFAYVVKPVDTSVLQTQLKKALGF